VLSRIWETIASFHHTVDADTSFKVTISIGLASHVNGQDAMTFGVDLLHVADRALYLAKAQGRNQLAQAVL
jgi:diguanylate cyclase (GGDEF)-like protein